MLIGYMRVSKADGAQVLDLQRDALLKEGVLPEQLYEDFAAGKNDDRQGLTVCLKALREHDTLVVWKLDRLGRNLRHLVNTVYDLSSKGIGFKVLTGQGAQIDTTAENLGNGATAKWRFLVRDSRSACVFTERKRSENAGFTKRRQVIA